MPEGRRVGKTGAKPGEQKRRGEERSRGLDSRGREREGTEEGRQEVYSLSRRE